MSTLFLDNFTRADAGNLGSNWDADDSGTNIDWDLDTNTAEAQGDQSHGNWIRTTSSAHADTADVKITAVHITATPNGGITGRVTAVGASPTGYSLFASSNNITAFRTNAGTEVQLGSGSSVTLTAGQGPSLELSGVGATVTVKTYYNGVLKETISDSSASRLTTAGRTGLTNWASVGTNSRWDDFLVEDLAGGGGGGTTYPGADGCGVF